MVTSWMEQAGVTQCQVTSSWRFPKNQARIMYEQCVSRGVAAQRKLYASGGNKVIDVFEQLYGAASPDEVKAAMEQEILNVGPEHISNHMNADRVTFDVSPASVGNSQKQTAFLNVLKLAKSQGVIVELIWPPDDLAFHIAIPVDGRGGWPPGSPGGDGLSPNGKTALAVVVTGGILLGLTRWLLKG